LSLNLVAFTTLAVAPTVASVAPVGLMSVIVTEVPPSGLPMPDMRVTVAAGVAWLPWRRWPPPSSPHVNAGDRFGGAGRHSPARRAFSVVVVVTVYVIAGTAKTEPSHAQRHQAEYDRVVALLLPWPGPQIPSILM
jgi:hypothetical protein